jgi:hypothetical protein
VILADWQSVVAAAPGSFLFGLFIGWIVSQRYAIVRRSDEPGKDRRRTDKRNGNGS